MLNGLDLFSGYGGIARALIPWVRTVAYCENNQYRQLALLCEMQEGRIDYAPIWDDVSTLRKSHIRIPIDVITGGWPCTGHSLAGTQTGLDHVESKLAHELIRIVREFRPIFCFLENVPGVLGTGMDEITAHFAADGYVGRYGVLSCPDVGPAWHERERVWIALADSRRVGGYQGWSEPFAECGSADPRDTGLHVTPWASADAHGVRSAISRRLSPKGRRLYLETLGHGPQGVVTNPLRTRLEGWFEPEQAWPALPFVTAAPESAWPEGIPEPTLCGKDDGPAEWICQIETLGGGVIPQVAREAFQRLMGLK